MQQDLGISTATLPWVLCGVRVTYPSLSDADPSSNSPTVRPNIRRIPPPLRRSLRSHRSSPRFHHRNALAQRLVARDIVRKGSGTIDCGKGDAGIGCGGDSAGCYWFDRGRFRGASAESGDGVFWRWWSCGVSGLMGVEDAKTDNDG